MGTKMCRQKDVPMADGGVIFLPSIFLHFLSFFRSGTSGWRAALAGVVEASVEGRILENCFERLTSRILRLKMTIMHALPWSCGGMATLGTS